MSKYCDDCFFLSLTEDEQNRQRELPNLAVQEHYCLKYRERVKHEGNHPHIMRLARCKYYESKNDFVKNDKFKFNKYKFINSE